MSWWKRWWRRRALKRLLPGYRIAEGYETMLLAVPVPDAMIESARESFFQRGALANYVGQLAFNKATTAVREALPYTLPHVERQRFTNESWTA